MVMDEVRSLRAQLAVAGISSSTGSADETVPLGCIKIEEKVEADGFSLLQGNCDHVAVSVSISIHPVCIEFDT